jgi:hypothetical protein
MLNQKIIQIIIQKIILYIYFTLQEVLGGLSNGDKATKTTTTKESSFSRKSKTLEKADSEKKLPAPKPPIPVVSLAGDQLIPDAKEETAIENAKKPGWLAELSRKQANRRSGLFSIDIVAGETKTAVVTSPTTTPTSTPITKISPESPTTTGPTTPTPPLNKPTVIADKPHIPLKPSQIRDEGN